jgi:putative transposase
MLLLHYNQSGFKIEHDADTKCLLWLAKLGHIEIRIHRIPINIKQATIVMQAGKWFAVVGCANLRKMHSTLKYFYRPVGIDVGITNYAYDSNGNHTCTELHFLF